MSSSTGTIIESLRRTAQGLPGVDVLVLFGSRAGEAVRADSDVDIAVGLSAPSAEVRRAVEVAFARAVLPVTLASDLRAMVGLRNRIAHGYATLNHERLHEQANHGLAAMRAFLVAIADAAGSEQHCVRTIDPNPLGRRC